MTNEIPRRAHLENMTAAERAIYDAQAAVERAGADPLLTEASILLSKARDKVADFVDAQPEPKPPPPADWSARDVSGEAVAPGEPNTELKADGQQKGYVVLTDAERRRGFVRPVRLTYRHVGAAGPQNPLRDLTPDEQRQTEGCGYVKFEDYPPNPDGRIGRYWTQAQLDKVGEGCGTTTSMSRDIAETYARDPRFYGSTFCVRCGTHLPVGAGGEFVWEGTDERVGT